MNTRHPGSWGLALCLCVTQALASISAEELEFTVWQDGMEAFVEYPALRVGEPARLITHLTLLEGNRPVREGELTLILERADGFEQWLRIAAPARTGIYLPELVPERPGTYTLTLHLEHPEAGVRRVWVEGIRISDAAGRVDADHDHDHGEEDHADGHDHDHGAEDHGHDDEGQITFLKEQQWRMEFASEFAIREPIARRLSLPAVVEAVPGRHAQVVSPSRGTLRPAEDQPWPQPGLSVRAGQAIAELTSLAGTEDTAQLEADLQASEARLRVAQAELSRVQGLVRDGVIPQRRLLEAEAEAATARGARDAAAARHREARGGGDGQTAGFALRTPLEGVITAIHAAPGQVVEANTPVASVLDDRHVWIRVLVPAQDLALIDTPEDLRIRLPGSREWHGLPDAKLVFRGHTLEQGSLPLVYEADNTGEGSRRLPPGLPLIASLAAGPAEARLTVPEDAVLDDDGVAVVMVMHGGETFERRPVRPGIRAAGRVAIVDGLEEHERVVTRGAYAVMLAGRETGGIDHGHAH
jgi:membrane fusion protein, heavy metal efflux system